MDLKAERCVKNLLIVDSIRGKDSTGLAFVHSVGDSTDVVKSIGDPFQLMDLKRFEENFKRANKCLIGHNRAATVGIPSKRNAHPFELETLIGVHNGTLENKYHMIDGGSFGTDSEALYNNFEVEGVEKTIEKVRGAYSLVWYNKLDDTINFLRNSERPMTFCFSEDEKTLYWASEAWMLYSILPREGVKHKTVYILPEDQLYSYKIPNREEKFSKPNITEIKQAEKYFRKEAFSRGTLSGTTKPSSGILTGITTFFRPMSWTKSKHGNVYINYSSIEFPGKSFRCYVSSVEDAATLFKAGTKKGIIGKIDADNIGAFYKVSRNTLTECQKEEEKCKTIPLANNTYKKDYRGDLIGEEVFYKRYSNCNFCSSDLSFKEEWVSLSKDACLCEACSKDSEVLAYLPTVAGMQ